MKGTKRKRLALSIRQPYAELILRRIKKVEYRSRRTEVRGVIYIYASLTAGDEAGFRKLKVLPGELPTGLVVGTVELVGWRRSKKYPGDFEWMLRNPNRLKRPFKPNRQPQPAWFYPK